LVVEMGISMGWEKYAGDEGLILGIQKYGASAPYKTIMEQYGFSIANICQLAKQLIEEKR